MVMVISGSSPLLGAKIKSMRRLIYDMYYAEEISMEICGKLINKLNEVSEKRRKKHGGY